MAGLFKGVALEIEFVPSISFEMVSRKYATLKVNTRSIYISMQQLTIIPHQGGSHTMLLNIRYCQKRGGGWKKLRQTVVPRSTK